MSLVLHDVLEPLDDVLEPLDDILEPLDDDQEPFDDDLEPLDDDLEPLDDDLPPPPRPRAIAPLSSISSKKATITNAVISKRKSDPLTFKFILTEYDQVQCCDQTDALKNNFSPYGPEDGVP